MKKKVIIIGIGLIALTSLYLNKEESPLIETIPYQETLIEKLVITDDTKTEGFKYAKKATAPIVQSEEVTNEQDITNKVETDFLSLENPKLLPKEKTERYGLLYGNYLKTSFYINEAAAGNIELSRETLTKAFKAILLYSKENSPEDIASALSMIKEDQPDLFQEALSELDGHQKEEKIEAILALNN